MPPGAVLFDFDGTLGDSYPAITASVNHVRATHNLPPLAEAEVRRHVGRGPEHLLRNTVPGGDPAVDGLCYRAHHPSVMREGTRLLPGAAEVVEGLKRAGRRVAVCSNKPVAFSRDLLAHLGLAPYLDEILGPEDVPRPKPAPDMLRLALERLQVAPPEALYVGDMVVDLEAGRGAGVRVALVATGSDPRERLVAARPDYLLDRLSQLLDLLR
jgi:phosphoglycolate phosphatase